MIFKPHALFFKTGRQIEYNLHKQYFSEARFSESVKVMLGRSYGADLRQTLDLFQPRTEHKLPLVVLIPGYYFCSMNTQPLQHYVKQLTNSGYAVALIHYRQAPEHLYPEQLKDLSIALRWLTNNVDNFALQNGFFLHGFNSGANLLLNYINALQQDYISEAFKLNTSLTLEMIQGYALSDGIYNFEIAPFQQSTWRPSLTQFFLGRQDQHAIQALASPVQHISNNSPPGYISCKKSSLLFPQFLDLKHRLEKLTPDTYEFGIQPNAIAFFDGLLHKDKIYPIKPQFKKLKECGS